MIMTIFNLYIYIYYVIQHNVYESMIMTRKQPIHQLSPTTEVVLFPRS
jgi:hypothetical protein